MPLACAGGQDELDEALNDLMGASFALEAGSRDETYRRKYLRFAMERHSTDRPTLPIMDNFTLANLMRYGIWLASNNVHGWTSARVYLGAAVKWSMIYSNTDVRTDSEYATFLYDVYRKEYKKHFARMPKEKINIQPALMAKLLDITESLAAVSLANRMEDAAYRWLSEAGVRIGHVAPKSRLKMKHALRVKDVVFIPSFGDPEIMFTLLRSTKTRTAAAVKPTWQAVRTQRDAAGAPIACAVIAVRNCMALAYNGDPDEPVFKSASDSTLPMGRTEFTKKLKERLTAAAAALGLSANEFCADWYAGVSFRKSCGSMLSGKIQDSRLANHMDHASVDTTRAAYARDSAEERANNSNIITNVLHAARQQHERGLR